jgi:hypothetical protein
MLQARRSRVRFLKQNQPLIETSIRKLQAEREEGQPVRKADKLTAICESILYKMWEPRRLITLYVSMAGYRDSFAFTF